MRTLLGWAARLILVLAVAGAGWSAAGVHGPASPAPLAGASVPAAPTFDVAAGTTAAGFVGTASTTARTTASVGLRLAGSGSLAPLDGSTSSSAHPQGRAGAHHAPRLIQGSGGRTPWDAAPRLPPLPPFTTTLPPPAGSRD